MKSTLRNEKMSRFLSNSVVGWIRRSLSEHENVSTSSSPSAAPKKQSLSLDECLPPPSLIDGTSSIFNEDFVNSLSSYFPPRIVGCDWRLRYTTAVDGFSLASIYRRFVNENAQYVDDSPVLICIEDTQGRKFGALVSEPLRIQESFYGNGQCFLFRLTPNFRVWPWSTKNDFFVSCSPTSLCVGAGDGHFGLSIDGDLNLGRTQRCDTFDNEPLVENEDFTIKTLEIWTFI